MVRAIYSFIIVKLLFFSDILLATDREEKPRFVGVYGGKLTAWRATAERVLERMALPKRTIRADTKTLRLIVSE